MPSPFLITSRGVVVDLDNGLPCFRPPPITDGSDNIFRYAAVLKGATELHVFDSSFAVLADALRCDRPVKKIYTNRIKWKDLYVNTTWEWV